jgi:hypothetical protein
MFFVKDWTKTQLKKGKCIRGEEESDEWNEIGIEIEKIKGKVVMEKNC